MNTKEIIMLEMLLKMKKEDLKRLTDINEMIEETQNQVNHWHKLYVAKSKDTLVSSFSIDDIYHYMTEFYQLYASALDTKEKILDDLEDVEHYIDIYNV